MLLQSVTPSGGYRGCVDVKKRIVRGSGGIARHTADVFRDPDVFSVPTLRIWQVEIVLRKRKFSEAVFGV